MANDGAARKKASRKTDAEFRRGFEKGQRLANSPAQRVRRARFIERRAAELKMKALRLKLAPRKRRREGARKVTDEEVSSAWRSTSPVKPHNRVSETLKVLARWGICISQQGLRKRLEDENLLPKKDNLR